MELKQLNKLFSKTIDIDTFKRSITSEVQIYNESLKLKGKSVPVKIKDDANLNFTKENLIQLCNYFVIGKLNNKELAYICDALLLSENVSYNDEQLIEYIEQMTDPEINGQFTIEDALGVIQKNQ